MQSIFLSLHSLLVYICGYPDFICIGAHKPDHRTMCKIISRSSLSQPQNISCGVVTSILLKLDLHLHQKLNIKGFGKKFEKFLKAKTVFYVHRKIPCIIKRINPFIARFHHMSNKIVVYHN